MTISALAANNALTGMLDIYSGEEEFSHKKHSMHVDKWSKAINALTDSLEEFGKDSTKLVRYLDGKQ
jgi:hypothetical protein